MNQFYKFSNSKWIGTRLQALIMTAVVLLFSIGMAQAQKAVQLTDQVNKASGVNSFSTTYNVPNNSGVLTTYTVGCDQETPSNAFENGLGNLHLLVFANDYTVNAGETFTMDSLVFNVLVEPGIAVNSVDIHFYEDSGNGPGEEMTAEAVTALAPSSSENIGEAFDFDVMKVVLDFDSPVELAGSGLETTYYVGLQIDYDGENSYMDATTVLNTPNEIYYYDDVSSAWLGSSDPASNFGDTYDGVISFYGECSELDACTGQPDAGTIEGDETFGLCQNTGFSLTVIDADIDGSGISAQWQKKDPEAAEDAWTDIDGANSPILNVSEGITEDTDYRFYVECDESGLSDTTEPVSVTVNSANDCYCTPIYSTGCSSGDRISNVSLTGESESLDNDSQCSDNDYGDYTDLTPPDLAPGETYTLSVSTDYGSPTFEQVHAWIDYNQDGQFSIDEEIANTNGNGLVGGTVTFDFTVEEGLDADNYRMRVRLVYGTSPTFDDCNDQTYGETEDYMVEIIQLETCTGTPTAGTIDDENFSVCGGNAFSISVSGASDPASGLERNWQSSPEGEDDWTNIDGATSNTYSPAEGIDEPTDFRYKVTCTNSNETDISDVVTLTLNPATECYCTPSNTGTSTNNYISNFTTDGALENINKSSEFSDDGYGDYAETDTLTVYAGQEIEAKTTFTGGTNYVEVWIDWNNDGNFGDDDEHVNSSGSYTGSPYTENFTVPTTVAGGTITRMRVRVASVGGTFSACEDSSYGETEDYTVMVVELEECEGMPTAGTIDEDFSVCAGNTFGVSVSDASDPQIDLDRVWQSSPVGEDDWTDIDGATSNTYTATNGIDEPTDFRYKVTCPNSGETDISDVVTVTINPADECYCIPEGTNTARYISDFTTTGAEQNITNIGSGFSTGGYGDFTDMTVEQVQSIDVNFEANTQGGTTGFRIWVDWNQDGQFDTTEEVVYQSSSYSNSHSGSFTVPVDAIPGETVMRVVSHYLSNTGSVDPCETGFTYGEFEDYTFSVVALADCEGTPEAGTIEDDFSVCAGDGFTLSTEGASGPATGLDRNWQSSPVGQDDWTDIAGSTSGEYFVAGGISEPTDFRYILTCNNSDETAISDVVTVTLNPANECFCTPEGASDNSDEIVNFTLGDLDNDSDSGSSTAGYSDFSDSVDPAELIPEQSYEAMLTSGSGTGLHGAAIWIDYNDNGFFEVEERVTTLGILISGDETIAFPEFTVPNSPGLHRLRVQYTKGQHGGDQDPCTVATLSSETEDYMVNVVGENCEVPSNVSVEIENTTVVVDWTENGSATEWELTYGAPGFNPESGGTSITVQNKPATISDLDPQTDYEIYVVAICDDDNVSDPSDSGAFTTGELSVNNQVFNDFTYYPNPVKGQLTLKAGTQIENVNVYNLLGQNIMSSKPNTLQTQLDTGRLQAGIYLMQVTISGNTKIFRVIKE